MDELLTSSAPQKERLDKLRPISPEALARLEHYYDIELTYTSNAIEGNTLSPVETTLVIGYAPRIDRSISAACGRNRLGKGRRALTPFSISGWTLPWRST